MQDQKLKIISQFMSFALCTIVLSFALCTLHFNKVYADGISISASPSLIKINAITPSDTKSPITIENRGNNAINIQILFKPFHSSKKENGEIVYLNNNEIPDIYKKIFNQIHVTDNGIITTNFELGPRQKKNLELQLIIPKNEPDSDYYFSVIFLARRNELTPRSSPEANEGEPSTQTDEANSFPDDENAQDQNFSVINAGIAINVLLSIGNKNNPQGTIEEFSAPSFLKSGPVEFTVRIKNIGSRSFAPKAIIFIKNIFGQIVGRVDIESDNILADSIRSLTDIQTASSPSKQKIFWRENFLLGPYTATLNIAISDKGPVYNQSLIFLAIPIPLIIGIILSILMLLIIFLRVRYHIKNDK
ncbi:hypothetical protein KKF69_06905 [Patescibacteria group bacterium]|nr:hypothetical protein [Patescibacteria group bacterium]